MVTSRTLCAIRLLLLAAGLALAVHSEARAQSLAHLSKDLQQHLDAGDQDASAIIVSGSAGDVDAFAARHGLTIRRRLTSGAVLNDPLSPPASYS